MKTQEPYPKVKAGNYRLKGVVSVGQCHADGFKILNGPIARRGDVVVKDGEGNIQVLSPSEFIELYEPTLVEKPAAVPAPSPTVTTFFLEPFDKKNPRSLEKAWVDIAVGLNTLISRALQLQKLPGSSKESSEATSRMREAQGWLRERPCIAQPTESEVLAAIKKLGSQ